MVIFNDVGIVVFLFSVFKLSSTQHYVVPEVKFEALKTGGFRVSIPDVPGTNKFNFNANINEDLSTGNKGKINGNATTATNGVFIVNFDNALKVGDTVNYKVFVTFGRLGYRKDSLPWTVTESDLHDSYAPLDTSCRLGTTTVNGKAACLGTLILVDEFDGSTVDESKWIVEHKIPTYEDVNNELNYYENVNDTRFFNDGILYLKPTPAQSDDELRGLLDLRNGCTSNEPKQCYHQHISAFFIPPVKSGRITSKLPFKYGKVEIKARLPAGDWIVPVVQIESKEKTRDGFTPKMFVAYSRGNDHLIGAAGDDIGGRTLYAGPVLNNVEPARSGKLKNVVATVDKPYSSDFHTYTLEWLPGKMTFYLDSLKYGSVDTSRGFAEFENTWNAPDAPFNKECVLSLGVAIGGVGEFPDGYNPGNYLKPWDYNGISWTKPFFDARNSWLPTWKGDNTALRVDYVKVWAV